MTYKFGVLGWFVVGLLVLSCYDICSARKQGGFAWEEVTEKDWSIGVDTARGITDAAFVFEKITQDEHSAKKGCYRTVYRRIRILSDEGRRWADGETGLLEEDDELEMLVGRAVLRDGTISTLAQDQIFEKEVIKTKHAKYRQFSFSIPGATSDCIVEYAYKTRGNGRTPEWMIQKEIPLLSGELHWQLWRLSVESGFNAAWVDWLGVSKAGFAPNYLWLSYQGEKRIEQLPNIKDVKEMVFTVGFVPGFREEPNSVPESSIKAKLITYYGPAQTPSAFWSDCSSRLATVLDQYAASNRHVKELVKQFDTLATEEAKIAAAYRWVQDSIVNTSYVDLDRGATKKNRHSSATQKGNESVDDVVKRHRGEEAEIVLLFCDMLREMNIDARVAFAKNRFDDLFVEEAKFWQFNECLAAVHGDSVFRFYAPGHPFTGLGHIPWYFEGGQALVSGGVDLQVIPFSTADSNKSVCTFAYTLDDGGSVRGQADARHIGQKARSLRMTLLDEDSTDYLGLMQNEIKEVLPNAEIDSVRWEHESDKDQPFRLYWQCRFPSAGTSGDRILLKPFDYMSEMSNPFFSSERKYALLFDYAFGLQEAAQFTLPEGLSIEFLPRDSTYSNGIGSLSVSFTDLGGSLVVNRLFTLKRPFWPSTSYREVQDLYQTWDNIGDMIVVLSASAKGTTGP